MDEQNIKRIKKTVNNNYTFNNKELNRGSRLRMQMKILLFFKSTILTAFFLHLIQKIGYWEITFTFCFICQHKKFKCYEVQAFDNS